MSLEKNKIYCMDCIEGMKKLEDNSVDSIVTDPPYELGFMGSGTTGMAAKSQDFDYIGFDMTEDYCEIARARIDSIDRQRRITKWTK